MSNTWPKGYRHAMSQSEHEAWNSHEYPGTLQVCENCNEPTGRCEDDTLSLDDGYGPLCEACWKLSTQDLLNSPTEHHKGEAE